MKYINIKARLVFLPLLLLALVFIISYTFLYWLLCIQFDVLPWKEDIIHIWIPVALAFLCVLIIIRPRVHLLRLDKDGGRIRTLYYLIGTAVCYLPTLFLINYLDTATGKLTELGSINEIQKKPATKYYSPNSYVLHKSFIGVESAMSYSGKRNKDLNFDIYIALPFTGHLSDTLQSPPAFLSIKYHKTISSNIDDTRREEEWDDFFDQSFERFDKEHIHFAYLERMPNTDERTWLIKAAKKSGLYLPGSPVTILVPIKESFNARNGNKMEYALLSFGIGMAVWFICIIIPGLHLRKAKKFSITGKRTIQEELQKTYEILKPRPGFSATPVLIIANVLAFVILVSMGMGFINFNSTDLISWGAIYEPLIRQGQWWRLATAIFLHGGVMHLLMNMVSLYIAGVFLELYLSPKKFVTAYLISGIIAGLVSLWWHDTRVVAVGASGAIFGLYGILLSFIISKIFDPTMNKVLLIVLAATAGYSLIMGFLSKGIDNSAHIGGLIAGLVIGFIYVKSMSEAMPVVEMSNDSR